MQVASEQFTYTVSPIDRGYYELSAAIVCMAVKDYRRLRKTAYNTREYARLRNFFLSDTFEIISGVENPNLFLVRLDEQIEKEMNGGVRRKREKQAMKCNG